MNSTTVYTEPVNRIKQQILFDFQLENISCICANWAEFLTEISEWGITLEGVDTLTDKDTMRLDAFILCQNGYEKEDF